MILCECTTAVDMIVSRGGYGHPPRRKPVGGWRRAERTNKSGLAYVTMNNRA